MKNNTKNRDNRGKSLSREVSEAEQVTQAVETGELTAGQGTSIRETLCFPKKGERSISATASQVILVLVPENTAELISKWFLNTRGERKLCGASMIHKDS